MSMVTLPLVLMPPTEDEREEEKRIAAKSREEGGKRPGTFAAVTRALFGTLAMLFKRPIRLFRPVKISTFAGLQAIAQEQGRSVTPSFVRGLIRQEGVSRITSGIQTKCLDGGVPSGAALRRLRIACLGARR